MTQKPDGLVVVPVQRSRGRPRVDEPMTTVCTWLPASQHDRLIEIAKQQERSVSAVVREFLVLRLR
jgi:hypothetical protein